MHSTLPRKLRTKLENATDDPIEIVWEQYTRTVTPLSEIFRDGRFYQPAIRSSPNKKGDVTYTAPQTFVAEVDDELVGLWSAGKIAVDIPYAERGVAADGLPAFRPWVAAQKAGNPEPTELDNTLVKVRMVPWKWIQIFPGMDLREIAYGQTAFYTTWSVVKSIGYGAEGPLELVE
jgi:hypothetical protein